MPRPLRCPESVLLFHAHGPLHTPKHWPDPRHARSDSCAATLLPMCPTFWLAPAPTPGFLCGQYMAHRRRLQVLIQYQETLRPNLERPSARVAFSPRGLDRRAMTPLCQVCLCGSPPLGYTVGFTPPKLQKCSAIMVRMAAPFPQNSLAERVQKAVNSTRTSVIGHQDYKYESQGDFCIESFVTASWPATPRTKLGSNVELRGEHGGRWRWPRQGHANA